MIEVLVDIAAAVVGVVFLALTVYAAVLPMLLERGGH